MLQRFEKLTGLFSGEGVHVSFTEGLREGRSSAWCVWAGPDLQKEEEDTVP